MAKFQLCKFLRVKPKEMFKAHIKWERGLACVKDYGVGHVDYIIDEDGDKVITLYDYRLLIGYVPCTIDTEEPSAFSLD